MNIKNRTFTHLFLLVVLVMFSHILIAAEQTKQRIVVLGGELTEIVYALGAEDALVAVDTTSQWPKEAKSLPQVGYLRSLSAEGIISLSPTLILASKDAGPESVLKQIKEVGIPIKQFSSEKTVDAVQTKIIGIAKQLNRVDAGEKLVTQLRTDMARLQDKLIDITHRPRVAFFLTLSKGTPLVAGKVTGADAMIKLAGGENAIQNFEGYKPANTEMLVALAPEFILVSTRMVDAMGGIKELQQLPAIKLMTQAKHQQIVIMDTLYLLGFGPRTGRAALELADNIHPELKTRTAQSQR
jgi:iron complex transport system substrate-binding protein